MTTLCVLSLLLASGCDDTSELAGRVDHAPIPTAEVELLLVKRGIRPEDATVEQRGQALEELIDQELFVQQAHVAGLDEDPHVAQAIKELLARAYLEHQLSKLGGPAPEDIAAYYSDHPQLFEERRRYQVQEIAIEATGETLTELEAKTLTIATLNELVQWLNERGVRHEVGASIKTGDELPMDLLVHLTAAKEGQVLKIRNPVGITVLQVVKIESAPVSLADASDDIVKYLRNRRIEQIIKETANSLRAKATIERYKE